MPHKPRRRNKQLHRAKPVRATPVPPPAAAPQTPAPVPATGKVPPARAPSARPMPRIDVATELKRIGILAGIIMAVLIVLAVVL